MWHLTVRLSAPAAGYFQELRQLLDRRDADTYLTERRAAMFLATADQDVAQHVAAWTLRNARVYALALEYVRDEQQLR